MGFREAQGGGTPSDEEPNVPAEEYYILDVQKIGEIDTRITPSVASYKVTEVSKMVM